MNRPVGDRTPMLEQYAAIKRKFADAHLFYRMGDFYEMFYEDAVTGSEVLGLRLTARAHGKGGPVPLAGFPYHQLDTYLSKMVEAGRRVVIVEQVEDPKKAKGLVKRDVVRVVTAGTNPAALDREEPATARVAALIRRGDRWGVAWADVASGEFEAGEFGDNQLGQFLAGVSAVELVVPAGDAGIGPASVGSKPQTISKLEEWIWEASFARRTLLDHFGTVGLKGFGLETLEAAVSAAGALLYYIKGNLRVDPAHITKLSRADVLDRMVIEPTSRRNLELVESLSGNPRATLFAVIDRSVTVAGRRLLFNRMLEPLTHRGRIEERLDAVEELVSLEPLRSDLRQLLRRAGDLQRVLARIATGRGSARDLVALRDTLGVLPTIQATAARASAALTQASAGQLDPMPELHQELVTALVDDPPLGTTEGGMIRTGYDGKVDELHELRSGGRSWLEQFERQERASTGISNLRVGYNRVFDYFIEITKSQYDKVPAYFIRRQTLVNAERFTTPELQEYQEKLLSAEELVNARENELYLQLAQKVLSASSRIQESAKALADLDYLASLAQLAVEEGYARPDLTSGDEFEVVNGRHPVVEKLLPPGETFVSNDLSIGGDHARILIITGPNMAGKSTYLRQVAICAILAQMGSFVPAVNARIGIVDKLFTRIGALDNLAGGESTFLVEMQETASILRNVTARSLVLFDEVGRGTSTFDGLSLAWAIVEYLHETPRLKPRTLFATHFHEMVELEGYLPQVKNYNVAVREYGDKIVFLRKIVSGGSDRSFGIHVAQMAGIPNAVIGRAREILANLEANDLRPAELTPIAAIKEEPKTDRGKGVAPKRHVAQLTFFDPVESRLREMLSGVEVEKLTPLGALNLVAELKRQIDG